MASRAASRAWWPHCGPSARPEARGGPGGSGGGPGEAGGSPARPAASGARAPAPRTPGLRGSTPLSGLGRARVEVSGLLPRATLHPGGPTAPFNPLGQREAPRWVRCYGRAGGEEAPKEEAAEGQAPQDSRRPTPPPRGPRSQHPRSAIAAPQGHRLGLEVSPPRHRLSGLPGVGRGFRGLLEGGSGRSLLFPWWGRDVVRGATFQPPAPLLRVGSCAFGLCPGRGPPAPP